MTELSDRFELEHVPPQLVRLKVEGDLGGNDVHAIFERIEPRRAAAERIGKTPAYAMALVGGSLAQRAIATLFLKLSELFSGNRDIAHKFLKDAASARAWLLDEARRRTARAR